MNKVLIIGKGGREHALAWRFSRSPSVSKVYVAPGNKGMENVAIPVNIGENDFDALIKFAKEENIALTFVGPEGPLVNGIVDRFTEEGLLIFGPTAKAAQIEGSKAFAKDLMKKYNIPTADYATFSDYEKAKEYMETVQAPIVLKADGLASGKGVVVASTKEEADLALEEMMQQNKFGDAGGTVVIEEFLAGEEFTFMAFVNGNKVHPMLISQDHKRVFDGDLGPNTGGMGAYSPVPQVDNEVIKKSFEEILTKTANAMVQEGIPFTGVLYAGLIATDKGPKVIEFNARFGDPEAEVILPRLECDLYRVITDILENSDNKNMYIKWSEEPIVGVVLAAKGYPGDFKTGVPIKGLENLEEDTIVFHCSTDVKDDDIVTNGGRVLLIAKKGETLECAYKKVYEEIKKINCSNLFYRKDIGKRALKKEKEQNFTLNEWILTLSEEEDD